MAVVTIISPAIFEQISSEGFGTCCGKVPVVTQVTLARKRKGDSVHVVVNCSNPECLFHHDGSGVFAADCDIHAKWEKYRHA